MIEWAIMDVVVFLIALSIVVVFHEFGHFFAAIKTGVKVEEFGLGLPPKIFGKKIGKTVFSVNALPIGGFCRLYGEDPAVAGQAVSRSKMAFCNKKPWQKMLIVMGGVMMNLVLAVLIFSVVYTILGVPQETERVKVLAVTEGSPADKAGLEEDDWIVGVGQVGVKSPVELIEEIDKYGGKEAELVVERENIRRMVMVEVRENPPEGEGKMGVAISNTEMIKVPWWQFYKGIGAGFREAYFWGKIIAGGVYEMVSGLFLGKVPAGVAGPVGMYQATTSIRRDQGVLAMVHFFGIISVNLAILNFMPFPALDGGRMIFVVWEWISKKRVSAKVESTVNSVGMAVLLVLLVLVTVGDVVRMVRGG